MIQVKFVYITGLRDGIEGEAWLAGSWDDGGNHSRQWSSVRMRRSVWTDGCPCYEIEVDFDDTQADRQFQWGVLLDGPLGAGRWAIATEQSDPDKRDRHRTFVLQPAGGETQGPGLSYASARREWPWFSAMSSSPASAW